jgi:hypothetical protein
VKEKQPTHLNKRLTVEDFKNPLFDRQKITRRTIEVDGSSSDTTISEFDEDRDEDELFPDRDSPRKKIQVIEGTTYTDGFHLVGFTYSLEDGCIEIKNVENTLLFKGIIYSSEEYEKALKQADAKQRKLNDIKPV